VITLIYDLRRRITELTSNRVGTYMYKQYITLSFYNNNNNNNNNNQICIAP